MCNWFDILEWARATCDVFQEIAHIHRCRNKKKYTCLDILIYVLETRAYVCVNNSTNGDIIAAGDSVLLYFIFSYCVSMCILCFDCKISKCVCASEFCRK